MRVLVAAMSAWLLARPALAANEPAEVKDIDARCTPAAKLDDGHRPGLRVLADLSEAVLPRAHDGRGKWFRFKSASDLADYAKQKGAPNTQARTWTAPDGTFIAAMFFQSDTGDWSQDVEYCFRADGTLARSKAIVVNHAEGIDGERIVYYASDERVLGSRARSWEAGKPRAGMEGLDSPPVYPTVGSLPFNAAVGGPPPLEKPPGTAPAPAPDGELTPEHVATYVRMRAGAVKACYERQLAQSRDLAGRVVVRWTIELTGLTRGASIESAPPPLLEVGACIVNLVKGWRFQPAPRGQPVDVSFPFVFQTEAPPSGRTDGGVTRPEARAPLPAPAPAKKR